MNALDLEFAEATDGGTSGVHLAALLQRPTAEEADDEIERLAAEALVSRHGEDSLSPFLVRPDKALHFAAGGVLAYRVIAGTAVISGDPAAPHGSASAVLASFVRYARERGWSVALWAASNRHLDAYRAMGLRAMPIGEEAFVHPAEFTLQGRGVRKLRQSVHRVARRGWVLTAVDGRDVDDLLAREIAALEAGWRAERDRVLGFAMSSAPYPPLRRPDDLYLLARSPCGELRALMRFATYGGNLSLDLMRRLGETPNGLNEAMVCRALEVARERGVLEVSLNYAGLAHLIRDQAVATRTGRLRRRALLALFGRRFQLERLVCFNEKFGPEWRPRFLVYESRRSLPRAALRVLQAEGYLPEPRARRWGRPSAPSLPAPGAPTGEPVG